MELGGWDYRIPGGRVFNKLKKYLHFVDSDDMNKKIEEAVKNEAREEIGVIVNEMKHYHTSNAGSSIVWDLYYYIIEKFTYSKGGQDLENTEIIEPVWLTFDEILNLFTQGMIKEDRSAAVLIRYILQRKEE